MTEQIKIEIKADSIEQVAQILKDTASKYLSDEEVYSTSQYLGLNEIVLSIQFTGLDNDAFGDYPPEEVSRILFDLASKLPDITDCKLSDINGTSVGRATLTVARPKGSYIREQSELERKGVEFLATFQESYLKRVKHLSRSGAVTAEDLDFQFLKAVLLLEAEEWQPNNKKHKEMLKNLRHF